ncbi:MAG TPA: pyridoxamine 5'-phosphate oxidase family protein [Streptosporangiaceae bacterium]|nr:pyridoxamine 5'-phosphate oxidase family protein [Streptosporangiaceae bacterium]
MTAKQPERGAVLTEDMKRVVREQRLGFVATVSPDGTPSLSPKGTTRVWDDEHLVFADIMSPGTVANLRANPAVEINVVDPIARKGYRFKGEAAVLTEGPVFDEILSFYESGAPPMRDARTRVRSLVLVRVERTLPLVSPSYDLGLTEEEISATWWNHHAGLRRRRQDHP